MNNRKARAANVTPGDRVLVTERIGIIGTRVPARTCGVVVAITVLGEVEVHFDNGRVELVTTDRIRLEGSAAIT